jgi:hypothetical protein
LLVRDPIHQEERMFSQVAKFTDLFPHSVMAFALAVSALVLATVPAQGKRVMIYNQASST